MYDSTEKSNIIVIANYIIQNAYCSWYEKVRGKGRGKKREKERVRDKREERSTLACSLYILTIMPVRIYGVYKSP